MSRDPDSAPYITVVKLFGVYHINRMEWDDRAEGYQVATGKNMGACREIEAHEEARKWATSEGLEVR